MPSPSREGRRALIPESIRNGQNRKRGSEQLTQPAVALPDLGLDLVVTEQEGKRPVGRRCALRSRSGRRRRASTSSAGLE